MQNFPRLAYGDFLVEGKLIGIREIGSESNIGKRLKRESQTIKKSCFIYGHITMGGRYQSVLLLIHEKMDLARPFSNSLSIYSWSKETLHQLSEKSSGTFG